MDEINQNLLRCFVVFFYRFQKRKRTAMNRDDFVSVVKKGDFMRQFIDGSRFTGHSRRKSP